MMSAIETHVNALIKKAAEDHDKDAAMRFSQAALNAAHAAQVLTAIRIATGETPLSTDPETFGQPIGQAA